MKIHSQKGFTLIELLVVISIIGLLSSIVFASLTSARTKGKDAAIKIGMVSFRSQMELNATAGTYGSFAGYVTGVGSYTACAQGNFADPSVTAIRSNITGNLPASTDITCSTDVTGVGNTAKKWAFGVILPSGAGLQCVDSGGDSKIYPNITMANISTSQINGGDCI